MLYLITVEDVRLGDIGFTIQNYVEAHGFSVVQDFCGHGIGKSFHEGPNIFNFFSCISFNHIF